MAAPEVFVCTKGGCGRRSEQAELRRSLGGVACLTEVRCQSVCEGPVAGTVVEGRLEWFERLSSPKARRRLRELVERGGAGPVPKALAKRRKAKRSGKLKR